MKQSKQKKHNRILIGIMIGCFLLVAGMSVLAGRFLHASDEQISETAQTSETSQETLVKEVGAVKAEEKMLGSTFKDIPGDKRKPLRIVEVIPHDICSIFPYLVDWKTVEGYDENTFIGYDGLRYMIMRTNKEKRPYSLYKDGITRDTLDNYDVTFTKEENWEVDDGWWRKTEIDEDILGVNGYFEYVGNNKGLYEINLNELVKADSTDYGIRYDIMAMKRKGTESKRGEWEVKDAQYYWAKDYADTTTYPDGPGGAINLRTGYNYDLKFQTGESGGKAAEYRVKTVAVMTDEMTVTQGYEYAAVLAEDTEWSGGYVYKAKGNYEVSSYTAMTVTASTDLEGKYIRVTNADKADGSGLEPGYFRLWTSEDDVLEGDTVYSVVFSKVSGGSYILSPAAVQSAISQDASTALSDIMFEYLGEGKGNYDVAFIYGPGAGAGALYSYTLLEVTNGDGRYALTSTESDKELLYEKVGDASGDYSKVVTNIDCAGIDYTYYSVNEWWGVDAPGYFNREVALPGLTLGCDAYGDEHGNWVFHTVDSDEINEVTKIEELEGGQVPANKRIYVYGQDRKNRYYAQNGFDNHEWFKLLMYLSSEDGSTPLAYQDYVNGTLTPSEIKEKYKKDIEAFDRAYRIEIIQKTPGELTASDVEKADLVYFGSTLGLPGMSTDMWNELVSRFKLDLDTCSDDSFAYTDDLSAEALMAIYDNCLYDRTTSLLFSAGDFGEYVKDGRDITSNLGKLAFLANLFEDPAYFAYFMEDYPEKVEDYSTIHSNMDVTSYEQEIQGVGILYNLGTTHLLGDYHTISPGDPIEPYRTDAWFKDYFRVVDLVWNEEGYYEISSEYGEGEGKYGYHWSAHGWGNYAGEDVSDDYRTWYMPFLTSDSLDGFLNAKNIWKILHNKKSKETSEPVVVVTNADGDHISELENITPIYYYYVDDFALGGGNTEFAIDFRVNWRPEEITEPNALVSVVVARSDGSAVFSAASPAYKTDYTCNVAGDFIKDGALNPDITSREYTITATDAVGKTDSVIVRFLVREPFMLN